jgi:hypothetical protein
MGGATHIPAFVQRFDHHVVGFVDPDNKVLAMVVEQAAAQRPVSEIASILKGLSHEIFD